MSTSMEISGHEKQPVRLLTEYIAPLGASQQRVVHFTQCCPGEPKDAQGEQLAVHIAVQYRDIFEKIRQMQLEFSVNPKTYVISRLEAVPVDFTS